MFSGFSLLLVFMSSAYFSCIPSANAGLSVQQILKFGRVTSKKLVPAAAKGAAGAAGAWAVNYVLERNVRQPNGQVNTVCQPVYKNGAYGNPYLCR